MAIVVVAFFVAVAGSLTVWLLQRYVWFKLRAELPDVYDTLGRPHPFALRRPYAIPHAFTQYVRSAAFHNDAIKRAGLLYSFQILRWLPWVIYAAVGVLLIAWFVSQANARVP